jgi:hypothetical protein
MQRQSKPDYSFTPERVHFLLREALNDNTPLPGSNSLVIKHLAWCLNLFRWKVWGWNGPWLQEREQWEKVVEAIQTLIDIPPDQRDEYVAIADGFDRWNLTKAATEARADLAAFDALIAAAAAAAKCGLPLMLNTMIETEEIRGWRDVAMELEAIFHAALPAAPKEAGYRFIKAAMPDIADEDPDLEAVKTELRQKRGLKRRLKRRPWSNRKLS